jgi:hypothetical protein
MRQLKGAKELETNLIYCGDNQHLLSGPLTSTLGQVPFRYPVKGPFAGNATKVVFLLHSAAPLLEYPRLKYQPAKAGPAGFLFDPCQRQQVYDLLTDTANDPLLLATLTTAPLTLPEYDVEVLL